MYFRKPYLVFVLYWALQTMLVSASTNVSSNVTQNAVWTTQGSPYIITKDITVNSGVLLTIEPGCEVRFAYNTNLTVKGRLSAVGYANMRIVFTSNDASPVSPRWGCVSISTLETNQISTFSCCDFYYGGRNIHSPLMINSPSFPQLDDLTFFNNKFNAVEITSAILGQDATIPNIRVPYLVINELVVPRERVLNVGAGVVIKFNTSGLLRVNGIINALGNEQQPIILTSVKDDYADGFDSNNDGLSYGQNGDWGGAVVDNPSVGFRSTFVNCRLSFAGGSPKSRYSTIDVEYSTVVAEACTFEHSAKLGILVGTNGKADLGGGISMGHNCFLGFNSSGNYAVSNQSANEVSAENNFWDETDSAVIARMIYDKSQSSSSGIVIYYPFLFTCKPSPPDVPELVAPAAGEPEADLSQLFKWRKVKSAYSYSLQVSKSNDFVNNIINVSAVVDTFFLFSGLEANTQYYWHVRAGNSIGQSGWSTIRSFRTRDSKPPDAPILVSPQDGAASMPCSLTFLWEKSSSAQSYQFQLAEDAGFASMIADEEGIASNNYEILNLSNDHTYFWRVKAKNTNGYSAWSAVRYFSTKLYPDSLLPVPFWWAYTNRTGQNMSIFVSTDANNCTDCIRIKPGDAIGVFYENDTSIACAGYAYWFGQTGTVLVAWGDNSSTSPKDGFEYREPIRFKLWDAQEGRSIDVVSVPESGVNYFFPDSMLVVKKFRRLTEQSIDLGAGTWTMVSSAVMPSEPAMEQIIPDSVSIISNVMEDYVFLRENLHEIRKWNIGEGYQVYSPRAAKLRIFGSEISPALNLRGGQWSILPYFPTTEMPPAVALQPIIDKILFMHSTDGSVYAPKFNINQIPTMNQGEGYKIILSGATTLEYPNSYSARATTVVPRQQRSSYYHENTGVHEAFILQSSDFADGDEIIAIDTIGKAVGAGIATNQLCPMVVYGHDIFNPEIKDGAMEGESLTFSMKRAATQEVLSLNVNRVTDLVSGADMAAECHFRKNALLRVDLSSFKAVNEKSQTIAVSPDPATNEITVSNSVSCLASVRIFNSLGCDVSADCPISFSPVSMTISVTKLSPGVYAAIITDRESSKSFTFRVLR